MKLSQSDGHFVRNLATSLLLLTGFAATGCQVEMGGQTLPNAYFLDDDIQYYAPGPEFKLANEAAAMQQQAAEIESQPQDFGVAR